jgi:collagenase-like PrtC family protease
VRGARGICLPPELPGASIAAIAASSGMPVEVFAFGRVPLGISARCYHARVHGLHKDNCRFVCDQDPDGMSVETLDHEPFLEVNGWRTLSHRCASLIGDIPALRAMGVASLRLSPQHCDMAAVAHVFRDVADGRMGTGAGREALAALLPLAPFSNGFLHGKAGVTQVGAA